MTALDAALDAFEGIEMTELAAKGRALCDLFVALADEALAPLGVTLSSPRDGGRRGSHVSLRHRDAYGAVRALIARCVVGDFRSPDVMRFGFAPLYVGFRDVFDAAAAVADVLRTEAWRDLAPVEAGAVT